MTGSSRLLWEQHHDEILQLVRAARDTEAPQRMWLDVRDGTVFLTTGPEVNRPAATYVVTWIGPWDTRGTIGFISSGAGVTIDLTAEGT